MDDATFRSLVTREPFGTCTDAEWAGIADRLLGSLSRFLGVRMEFVGDRPPHGDSMVPLVRSVAEVIPGIGVRFAGMISCKACRGTGLEIDAVLFVFVAGRRVEHEGNPLLSFDYLGSDANPDWVSRGWETSDFPEEYDPYTYHRFFEGAEAELPGCSGATG